MYKEIVEKILNLLQADATLSQTVKKWYFGFPPNPTQFPYIAVKFRGSRVRVETSYKERYEMDFEILVVDTSMKEDDAEKSVMSLVETVDNVLDGNPTLDGLVDDSHISEVASETALTEKGGVMVGALIMFTCFKTKI